MSCVGQRRGDGRASSDACARPSCTPRAPTRYFAFWPENHRHLVHLGSWPGSRDAVAADAHGGLLLAGGLASCDFWARRWTGQHRGASGNRRLKRSVDHAGRIAGRFIFKAWPVTANQICIISKLSRPASCSDALPRRTAPSKFQGSDQYVATQDLMLAVNAAITLKRPLLVRASPAPARRCWPRKWPPRWACRCCSGTSKSTTKAQQGL